MPSTRNLFIAPSGPSPVQGEQASRLLLTQKQPWTPGLCKGALGILCGPPQERVCSPQQCCPLPSPCAPGWVPAQAHGGGFWSNSSCPQIKTSWRDAAKSSCCLHAGLHLCWHQPRRCRGCWALPAGQAGGPQSLATAPPPSSPRAQHLGPAFGAICMVCGWCRCSHCKPNIAVPSLSSDTLSSLASVPKVTAPRTLASHLAACRLRCRGLHRSTAEQDQPWGGPVRPGGSQGARLPSPLRLGSSAPAALRKLHKYSWQTEGNVTVPADYTRLS